MPRGSIGGTALVASPNIQLCSAWATVATILALTASWRLAHHCFQFGVLTRSPWLGRVKPSDGRSPRVLAGHFTSVANAVVCIVAYASAARQRLAADSWSSGALFPLWSRPLAIGPPPPGTSIFYLSLAAYCLNTSVLSAERLASGATAEQLVLLQRVLLFLLASSACMAESVPELTLTLLLLEVPSPFGAMWQVMLDFRARTVRGCGELGIPILGVLGGAAVLTATMFRFILFGLCLGCTIFHPDAHQKLWGNHERIFTICLCIALLVTYVVSFVRLSREIRLKTAGALPQPLCHPDLEV